MSSSIIRPIAGSITLISSYGLYSSYHSRPKPDIENGKWGGPSHYPEKTVTEKHRGQVEGLSDDRKVGESYKERLRNNTIGEGRRSMRSGGMERRLERSGSKAMYRLST